MNLLHDYYSSLLSAKLLAPSALWLFVLLGGLFLLGVLKGRRSFSSLFLRAISASLLILALADPVKEKNDTLEQLAALVDVSASISEPAIQAFSKSLKPFLKQETTLELYPFGKGVVRHPLLVQGGDSERSIIEKVKEVMGSVDTGQTNIASAINSLLLQSESSSALLLTDGYETDGNALQQAKIAVQKGLRIFPLIPDERAFEKERLSISSLYAPVTAQSGDVVEVRASIKNSHREAVGAKLELWLDSEKLFSQFITIPADEEKLVSIKTPPTKGGLKRLRAVLKPEQNDSGEQKNNEIERYRWISIKEKSKILLISGSRDDERLLKQLIGLKGYALEDYIADGSRPLPEEFESYSSVILNNTSNPQLPRNFLPQLEKFVRSGGGLLLIGGDRSYGLGGYIRTLLEDISPLKFVPPQTEKRRLNNAVALLIDKSGSMAEDNKIFGAKLAAVSAIESLKDDDYIGVIGFDAGPFVIIDVKPVPEVREEAERRLRNLTAAGKTNLLPALAEARRRLVKSQASRKHIIVLSDGKFPLSSDDYVNEINSLRGEGISVSTVALGIEADVPFMKLLAKYGKGAFYQTLDPRQLPKIFVDDIKVTTGEKTLKEGIDCPVAVGPGGLRSTTVDSYPPVRGFVEALPKKGSDLELITRRGDDVYPLLASWLYGSGKVVAFTSDANGRWSSPWVSWREFATFWSQVIEGVKDKSNSKAGDVDFDLRYSVQRKSVMLDLAVFDDKLRTQGAPPIAAEVIEPGGEQRKVTFHPTKRGRFEAEMENGRPGDYKMNISYGDLKLPVLAITLSGDAFGEVQGQGVNVRLLGDIAYATGGKINPEPKDVQGLQRTTTNQKRLFLPLAVVAFFLILFEAFWREGALPFARLSNLRKNQEMSESKKSKVSTKGSYSSGRKAA